MTTASLWAQTTPAGIKEASLVTEVLPWGETLTAIRLEYPEDIDAGELTFLAPTLSSDSELPKFRLFANRAVTHVYVNSSGRKGDVKAWGRYVFLDLGVQSEDAQTYRSQVTFSTAPRVRAKLAALNVAQVSTITTRSGKVLPPANVSASREICVGIDEFATYTYKNDVTGHILTYHLYTPKGYETKAAGRKPLPLVVHFPAADYGYADHTGKYRGALFAHRDVLYWTTEEAQAEHPGFVVTAGGPIDPTWASGDFAASEMQQSYVKVVQKITADYNIDASRVYAVSLAGGSPPMWSTILANPGLFAAQISTAYDPYHAYRKADLGEERFAALLDAMPGWFFAGLKDPTGYGILGAGDTRFKGERLRDVAAVMNMRGKNVDVAYGKEGEQMWNGLLRGSGATRLGTDQLAHARAHGATRLVTIYLPGTVLINQHWVWDATYSNAGVRDWLFQQGKRP